MIKAVDADDPDALIRALRREGADPNAVVDADGYGGFRWTVWAHRMAGASILHLALKWGKVGGCREPALPPQATYAPNIKEPFAL